MRQDHGALRYSAERALSRSAGDVAVTASAWRGSQGRREAAPRVDPRRVWGEAIELGARAHEGWREAELFDFRHALVRCSAQRFPIDGVSGENAARAFKEIGLALANAGLPERLAAIAPAVAAVAKTLDELMNGPARAAARLQLQRQFPDERDD